ncbi:hypothetical protein [Limosilactobacillus caecicola]|uniref:hypothetical protein n=1 Tax=Limosilactobacillus caecicola TaxID=2941332 RepID=UPI00203E9DED|nr:hypothetical protein [Limosilactobacillus caecicola]
MNSNKKTLVEQHAVDRLHKVEKEKRKPYVKQPKTFSFQRIFMIFIFLVVLLVMLSSII